jgi:hypothetical protein
MVQDPVFSAHLLSPLHGPVGYPISFSGLSL